MGLKEKQVKEARASREEDQNYTDFSNRARLVRQIKAVLGFPVNEALFEHYEHVSTEFKPTVFEDGYVQYAMRYFDPMVTEEAFAAFLLHYPHFYALRLWLQQRWKLIEYIEFEGPWFELAIRPTDTYPASEGLYCLGQSHTQTYHIDRGQVNTQAARWQEWHLWTAEERQAQQAHEEDKLRAEHNLPSVEEQAIAANGLADQQQSYTRWQRMLNFLR